MTASSRRVITARDVEDAAFSGQTELPYDTRTAIVTPLARARAHDLGVSLSARAGAGGPRPAVPSRRAAGGRESADLEQAVRDSETVQKLRPELAAEVLRRVQQRLEQR